MCDGKRDCEDGFDESECADAEQRAMEQLQVTWALRLSYIVSRLSSGQSPYTPAAINCFYFVPRCPKNDTFLARDQTRAHF